MNTEHKYLYKFNITPEGKVIHIRYRVISSNSKGYIIEFSDKQGKLKRKFVGKIKEEVFAYVSPQKAIEAFKEKLESSLKKVKKVEESLNFRLQICKEIKKVF